MQDVGGSLGAGSAQRYIALDSLRGICAILVALYHFHTMGVIVNSALVLHSYIFVDFFFVLSGFVIAASYGERLRHGFGVTRFMMLRAGRLLPLHLVVLGAFLAFEVAGTVLVPGLFRRAPFSDDFSIPALIYAIFLVHIFVGPLENKWNAPSWSIAAEFWTYLIFAAARRYLGARIVTISLVLVAGSIAFLIYGKSIGMSTVRGGALPRCLYGFGVGTLAFELFRRLREPTGWTHVSGGRPGVSTACEILAIATCVVLTMISPGLFVQPIFAATVILFAFERGRVSRMLRWKPFVFLGTLSYSIYMTHEFIEFRVNNMFDMLDKMTGDRFHFLLVEGELRRVGVSPLFGDIVTIATMGLIVAVSYLTYRLIELPGQRWSRDMIHRRADRGKVERTEEAAPTF